MARGAPSGGALPILLAPLACLAGGVLVYRAAAGAAARRRATGAPRSAARAPGLDRAGAVAHGTGAGRRLHRREHRTGRVCPRLPGHPAARHRRSGGRSGPARRHRHRVAELPDPAAGGRAGALARSSPAARSSRSGAPTRPSPRVAASVTVPALGVPASGLHLIHGWRAGDGSLSSAARRLIAPGPARNPGPQLPAAARTLSLTMAAPATAVQVTADLRSPAGAVTQVPLGPRLGAAADGHGAPARAGLTSWRPSSSTSPPASRRPPGISWPRTPAPPPSSRRACRWARRWSATRRAPASDRGARSVGGRGGGRRRRERRRSDGGRARGFTSRTAARPAWCGRRSRATVDRSR